MGLYMWSRLHVSVSRLQCLAGGLDIQGTEKLRVVVDTFGRNSCKSQVGDKHK